MTSACLAFGRTPGRIITWLLLPMATLPAPAAEDYVEHFDTTYNSLTVERKGPIVELRARLRGLEALESAVDLRDPLRPIVAYTRSLYGALFVQPNPAPGPHDRSGWCRISPAVYRLLSGGVAPKPSNSIPRSWNFAGSGWASSRTPARRSPSGTGACL